MKTRQGFTLIEMLVAITILIILIGITAAAWNGITAGDPVKGAAESVKAQINGARDRATFYSRNSGVRLIRDPSNPQMVTSLVYVLQPEPYESGQVEIHRDPATGDWTRCVGIGTQWYSLFRRGGIEAGNTYIMLNDQPYTFTVELLSQTTDILRLTKAYPGGAGAGPVPLPKYSLLVEPVVAANQEPIRLPRNVAIDLASSIVPFGWQDAGGNWLDNRMQVLFSPRGEVQKQDSGGGTLKLVIADQEDISLGRGVEVLDRKSTARIVTVQFATGRVFSSPVNETDHNGNGRADDPFEYAETGESVTF